MPVTSSKPPSFWREQIKLALAGNEAAAKWQDANLKAYAPSLSSDPDDYGTCINTNRDFTLVERKKADLFYQRPEVSLQPSPLLDGPIMGPNGQPLMSQPTQQAPQGTPIPASQALSAHELIVNEHLGSDGIDATRMVHSALFDVLCTNGVGYTVMGYESATVDVETGQVDPLTGEPQMAPVPIKESCFWQHFSPKRALKPHNFRSTDWDRAPWLGHRFELPLSAGNRKKYRLPEDFKGGKSDTTQYFDHGLADGAADDVFTGVELWYRSSLFRDDRPHPDHLTHLVLVDGIDEPVIEEDCPYQTLDKQGQLTPDSLIGFPIHPLNMRTLTDSSNPPSDCTLIRPLVSELNRFREQMVQYRDINVARFGYRVSAFGDAIPKLTMSPMGGLIGLPDEAFPLDQNLQQLPHGSMPRESFTSNDYIDADIARTTAIDAAGAGVQSQTNQTATEAQIQQGNANARLDFERGVVLQWYVKGVTKFSTLLQRYLPVADAAKIVGTGKAQTWDAWRRTVPSTLAFTAMPDSALRVDQAVDRKQGQDLYTYLAQDPNVNRKVLLSKLLRKFHLNPDEIVIEPPPSKPEPHKISLAIKAENLNPFAPEYTNVYQLLTQNGTTGLVPPPVDPATAQAMQIAAQQQQEQDKANAKHGGKVAQMESLDKHAVQQSGGMQGTGAPAAMGMGGGHLQ